MNGNVMATLLIFIGIDLYNEAFPNGLSNTTIRFLPANATSLCQPLDQGIIRTWKAYYRKKWLRYICSEYGEEHDPMKTMNVLQAIRWAMDAWGNDVTTTTVNNC